jgi:ferredoxin--NADP+ reductase
MTDVSTLDRPAALAAWHSQPVLWTRHWTSRLFSFAIARPESFRFRAGEFVMIGLPTAAGETGKPVIRAYSIASAAYADELEFFSIHVPDGALTSRLGRVEVGDRVLLGRKPTGTLVLDALRPGRRLFLVGTGTGLAPWLSLVREPDLYQRFEQVVLTHTVRETADLAYREFLTGDLHDDPLVGDQARAQLIYYPTVTRQTFGQSGRITDRIRSGSLFADLGLPPGFDPTRDRVMLCGSMAMIREVATLLDGYGLVEGSNAEPGDYVLERAFVG